MHAGWIGISTVENQKGNVLMNQKTHVRVLESVREGLEEIRGVANSECWIGGGGRGEGGWWLEGCDVVVRAPEGPRTWVFFWVGWFQFGERGKGKGN